jgi:ankyrin repeat protein
MTPLALASSTGQAEVAVLLFEHCADMNAQDNQSWTPLHFASRYGHVEMTRLLLDRGVDPNIPKVDLWHALHLASANGHLQVAQMLILYGARVDVSNDEGETPFDRAAGNGDIEILCLLIENGASLHTTDNYGCTPLHSASRSGHLEVVKLLLGWGADVDVDVLNKANKTAGEMASENGKIDVSSFLAEYKADANVRNKIRSATLDLAQHDSHEDGEDEQSISLHTACEDGKVDVVTMLLDRGTDINSRITRLRFIKRPKMERSKSYACLSNGARKWIHVISMGGPLCTLHHETDTSKSLGCSSTMAQT